jgi:hypothetical protein
MLELTDQRLKKLRSDAITALESGKLSPDRTAYKDVADLMLSIIREYENGWSGKRRCEEFLRVFFCWRSLGKLANSLTKEQLCLMTKDVWCGLWLVHSTLATLSITLVDANRPTMTAIVETVESLIAESDDVEVAESPTPQEKTTPTKVAENIAQIRRVK